MQVSLNPYQARSVQSRSLFEYAGWRLKPYVIFATENTSYLALEVAAYAAAQQILTQPAVLPPLRYGVGFLIIHAGRDSDFVLVGWWSQENELALRVLTAPPGQPEQLTERTNLDGTVACVWDLAVIWREREAWVKHLLRCEPWDIEGYLADVMTNEIL